MIASGYRSNRLRIERRAPADDGFGNTLADWQAVGTIWASFRPHFGSEQVKQGALQSTLQGVAAVLSSTMSRAITPADRVVFAAGPYAGRVCNIRSVVPSPDGAEIEILLEEGVAT